jgi:hypothetical protein
MKNQISTNDKPSLEKSSENIIDITQDVRLALQEDFKCFLADEKNKGWSISTSKLLSNLIQYIDALEKQLAVFSSDFVTLVKVLAETQVSHFGLRTNTKAIVRALVRKGLITEEELFNIHRLEIVPEELPKDQREEYLETLKNIGSTKEQDM